MSSLLDDVDDGYRHGSNGGTVLAPSKASSTVSMNEGEIYTRADGKRVRRIRRSNSSSQQSAASLSGFLSQQSSDKDTRMSGSRSVGAAGAAGGGGIHIRADGKKVRRVKKSSASVSGGSSHNKSLSGFLGNGDEPKPKLRRSSSVAGDQLAIRKESSLTVRRVKKSSASVSGGSSHNKSLSGFLGNGDEPKPKLRRSSSVAGDQLAISKESSLTGEIYVRADGKKVRRVRKSSLNSDANVEIITRPDGTKARRIRKTKPSDDSIKSSNLKETSTSTGPSPKKIARTLSGFLDTDGSSHMKSRFSGSHSVAGDKYADGEIYVRADGKKVRRVRKNKHMGSSESVSGLSLSGFLDSDVTSKPKMNGAATVVGDTRANTESAEQRESEIYIRPDGKKVRRIRKTALKSSRNQADERQKSLGNFFDKIEPSTKKKYGGSNSVAGDQIAISKESSLTGEIYVRGDGKKVRRVKRTGNSTLSESSLSAQENVEIITRPDGKRVRRIRKTKPKAANGSNQLSGFLESQPKSLPKGSAATVTGGHMTKPKGMIGAALNDRSPPDGSSKLSGFLESQPKSLSKGSAATVTGDRITKLEKYSGSASVAGDQIAVRRDSSLSGEVYIREDGKKVRRIKKPTQTQPGDQVEIITRPDGTKVRRIRRVKKSVCSNSDSGNVSLLDSHLRSTASPNKGSSASVAGDRVDGEIYIRADGKKVRRVRKPARSLSSKSLSSKSVSSSTNGEDYEIYVRPDGKKVRRIRRKVLSSNSTSKTSETSLETMLSKDKIQASKSSSSATVAGDYVSGKSSSSGNIDRQGLAGDGMKRRISLNSEDEEIGSKYRKMLKMGMPEGAVIQKMTVDGVAQDIQDSIIVGDIPCSPAASTQERPVVLDDDEEEIASKYRKMLKMGMPEGAVIQKMTVDSIPQTIQDSVLGRQEPNQLIAQSVKATTAPTLIPEEMDLVQKDGAILSDGMVLISKEQAQKIIPEGMMAMLKDQVGEGVPDGYVLVPKDRVHGEDDNSPQLVFMGHDESSQNSHKSKSFENVDISGAHIVSMNDLTDEVEKLKKNDGNGGRPRFLLQALPEDREMEDDFIRKNLLPSQENAASPSKDPEVVKKAVPSSSVAEVLAQMSSMGGDFDAEKMQELLEKLETAEKRQKKLEQQLAAAGVTIAEDIDYDVCVKKVDEIGKRMNEIGGSDVTHPDKEEQNRLREEYFKLEQAMEKYNSALLITDEYVSEQIRLEKKWEDDNAPGNLEALKKVRRHMPVEVRNMSEAQLTNDPSPNGKFLPKSIAKKFKRTNILQIIRRHPNDIIPMHPSTLENMRVTGLTLTERRAVYEHIRVCGPKWKAQKAEKMTERKWVWFKMMKDNFKENLASYQRHVAQYGPPGNHPYATRESPNEGCPMIGKQCPLRADKLIDYDKDDYGYPDGDVYEVSEVRKADTDDPGAKAMAEALELMKEKKSNERSDALKKHYKGKLLQVAKSNGSCENMDEMVEKMEYGLTKLLEESIRMGDDKSKLTDVIKNKEVAKISDVLNDCKLGTLDICGRSGMQLSGKKTNEEKSDPRSIIECSLAEEVLETFDVFRKYVTNRLKKIEVLDTRVKSTIEILKELLDELHQRNIKTIKDLGGERLERSHELKTQKYIENKIKEQMKAEEPAPAAEEESRGPPLPGPPRGGLMDAIKGKGGRGGGGRGGLLGAIQGRGRGNPGGGGRGGLLDAIQGRGRGNPGGGGRGGLLDAIQGRGRGNPGGRGRGNPGGGGRGGLLDAIQSRKKEKD